MTTIAEKIRQHLMAIAALVDESQNAKTEAPKARDEPPFEGIRIGGAPDPSVIGYAWMESVFGFSIVPVSSMHSEYRWLGLQSEADRAKVAAALAVDPWIQSNLRMATARHIVRHWGRYLEPPAPQEPKTWQQQKDALREASVLRALRDFDAETAVYLRMAKSEQQRTERAERRAVTRMSLERKG
jgi:hypothetical protein